MTPREKAIEYAAQAIGPELIAAWRRTTDGSFISGDDVRGMAAAAFDAILSVIMEPDEAMIEAGLADETICSSMRDEIRGSYQAMIRKLMGDRG